MVELTSEVVNGLNQYTPYISEIEKFVDNMDTDDCGSEYFGEDDELKVYYEGFTDECWADLCRTHFDEDILYVEKVDNQLYEAAQNELLNDWSNREGGEENLLGYGWKGNVFYAVFYQE